MTIGERLKKVVKLSSSQESVFHMMMGVLSLKGNAMGKINVLGIKGKNAWSRKKRRWICFEKTKHINRMQKYNSTNLCDINAVAIEIFEWMIALLDWNQHEEVDSAMVKCLY